MGKSRGFDGTTFKAARILQNTVGCNIFPVNVKIAPLDQRRMVRRVFNKIIKDRFRQAAAEVFGSKAQYNKTIHHMLPIFLGGTNDHKNLVFLPERIHTACHILIDSQIVNMTPRETREILIPYFTRLLIHRL